MKMPSFLLGAALLFWGWQTDFLLVGGVMAVALESARFTKSRWEVSDEDFSRIWTFCALVILVAAVYAFTANEGPASFRGLFQEVNLAAENKAGASSARTAISVIRWFPMAFFLFVAAQNYSSRGKIPLLAISLIQRRRRKRAQQLGEPLPIGHDVDVSYPYFAGCLFAASAHGGGGKSFFWGLCPLLIWALWSRRSPRFGLVPWAVAVGMAIGFGYLGQLGIVQLQRLVEGYTPQWLSGSAGRGFDPTHTRTEIGQIGRIKTSGKIVIRLDPKSDPAPNYLREASYRAYSSGVWHAGSSKNDFVGLGAEADLTSWVLQPRKINSTAVNMACYLDGGKGLLPLPTGCGRLENLAAYVLEKNSAGAVLATGPGLVIFDAHYGPGPTIDSPANTNLVSTNEDLAVPSSEEPALDQVISDLHLTAGQGPERAKRVINGFFQDKFSYSLWQRPAKAMSTNETPLTRFLLRSHSGHCEYFATATVLLLRKLGIPARYAVGYAVHEATSGSKYVVRLRDAHAWCLVWNDKDKAWHDFDTTPASWVEAENRRASALQFLSDGWSRLTFELSKLRWGQTRLRQYILWTLIPVLALLLSQIIFRRGRTRQSRQPETRATVTEWPGLDSEFYQLEKQVADLWVARQPGESLATWLRRAAVEPAFIGIRAPLEELLRLHYRYRFDPQGLSELDREALRREVKSCLSRAMPEGKGR
ncbi:MAG: transglutaminase-like enzyme predicted cysteine protease [Pedosphaera sp.]|nr:transglutaminase-like enzyme predicted cysteine protease [Pedosphaera sp.]